MPRRAPQPNEEKKKECLVQSFVMLQIKYLGVLESIEVRKQTYPVRKSYYTFFQMYKVCEPEFFKKKVIMKDCKQECVKLITKIVPNLTDKQVLYGNSKLYLKLEIEQQLDRVKTAILHTMTRQASTTISKCWRGLKVRRMVRKKKEATKKI